MLSLILIKSRKSANSMKIGKIQYLTGLINPTLCKISCNLNLKAQVLDHS